MRGKYDDGRRRGNEEWGVIKITFPQCYNLALDQRKEAENTVNKLTTVTTVTPNQKIAALDINNTNNNKGSAKIINWDVNRTYNTRSVKSAKRIRNEPVESDCEL